MNEYGYFNLITLTFFELSNTFLNRYNVSNDVNSFDINMKCVRQIKKS